ncbi:MAG: thymidylate synthase [bacterium]
MSVSEEGRERERARARARARDDGNIPVLKVEGKTLPEAWEKAVVETWKSGLAVRTEYDREGDPPSRDCTMVMVAEEPLSEPRIHRAMPCSLEDLEIYRCEVLDGVHDHWIAPEEGKWTYTYHQRLFAFEIEGKSVDQMEAVVRKLAGKPWTRRAQAITWNPLTDPPTDDPPCLQRVWCRLVDAGGTLTLNMNTHWRSRDAYKAAFMNVFAMTELQRWIAEKVSEATGREVIAGRYTDVSDSFHIYGSYFGEFEGFLTLVGKRAFEERTWDTAFAEPFFEKAREKLKAEREGER